MTLRGRSSRSAAPSLVIAATTHLTEKLRESAHVVLPVGTFAESAGSFVNVEGRWQSWTGAALPVGESRPGWKVLRVLANLLNLHGVDYVSSEEVREAIKSLCGARLVPGASPAGNGAAAATGGSAAGEPPASEPAWVDIPPYQIDVLVRGSESLAKTKDGHAARTVL